jgi:opine dehydrogenase
LVLLETLGIKLNVNTPICTALINIASAALKRDLRAEGRTVERLGETILQHIINDKLSMGHHEVPESDIA